LALGNLPDDFTIKRPDLNREARFNAPEAGALPISFAPSRFGKHSRTAFTLLEILIAMALLALVVGAIYSSWNAILKGSRVALDAAAAAQRTRIAARTVHDAFVCSCMFNASGTNNYYGFNVDGSGEDSFVSFVARLPKSFPRSGKFGDFAVRRVELSLESGKAKYKQLVMRQRPIIMDFDKDEQQFPLVLARDVSKFVIEFIDPNTGDWTQEWVQTNALPREVRITLGLGHLDQFSSKPQDVMVDVVAIPSIAVPTAWQAPQNPGRQGAPNNNGAPGGGTGPGNPNNRSGR
jgi:general secretion pathway protein J